MMTLGLTHTPLAASILFMASFAAVASEDNRIPATSDTFCKIYQQNEPATIVLTGVPRDAVIKINARERPSKRPGTRVFVTSPIPVGEPTIIPVTIRVGGRAAKIAIEVEGGKEIVQKVN